MSELADRLEDRAAYESGRHFSSLLVSITEELPAILQALRDGEKMREALKPFQREADRLDPQPASPVSHISDNVEVWQCGSEKFRRSRLTYGDLRAARSALTGEGQ